MIEIPGAVIFFSMVGFLGSALVAADSKLNNVHLPRKLKLEHNIHCRSMMFGTTLCSALVGLWFDKTEPRPWYNR